MIGVLYRNIRDAQLTRDLKISYLVTLIVLGFSLMTLAHYYGPAFPHLHFVNDLFPAIAFGDFLGVVEMWKTQEFNGVGYGGSYFPATYLVVKIFSYLSDHHRLPGFWPVSIAHMIFLGFLSWLAYAHLKSEHKIETILRVFACTCMTYPVLFTINTGNFESFVFIFVALFAYWYHQGKFVLSTLPLAMAIAMKLFPAVFLVLFLADKKYKEFFYVLGGIIILTLIPLLFFDGGILGLDGIDGYLSRLKDSQKMYADLMIMSPAGNHYGHSLLNGIWTAMGTSFPDMHDVLVPYMLFALCVFALVATYIALVETVYWKKIALLVICMCLLPYTSTDYKLLHFYAPLFFFINDQSAKTQSPRTFDLLYIFVFGFLLVPKGYFFLHNNPGDNSNVMLNPLLMTLMLIVIVGSGLKDNGLQRGWERLRAWRQELK